MIPLQELDVGAGLVGVAQDILALVLTHRALPWNVLWQDEGDVAGVRQEGLVGIGLGRGRGRGLRQGGGGREGEGKTRQRQHFRDVHFNAPDMLLAIGRKIVSLAKDSLSWLCLTRLTR